MNSDYEPLDKSSKVMKSKATWGIAAVALLGVFTFFNPLNLNQPAPGTPSGSEDLCPQAPKYDVVEVEKVNMILNDPIFRNSSAHKLSGALQVDTVVYDVMEMKDYAKFAKFHDYLSKEFPLAHKHANLHKVNTYGLVFEFKGSNEELKPIMLCAHQDTVPIGDPSDWVRDPWSGEIDDEKIYGRGAGDVKNLLVGLLESVELLLEDGKGDFERSVILAFGFDEEKSGWDGAQEIGKFLEEYLGYDSIEFLIDEGPSMFTPQNGDYYGMIMNGEKGYMDLQVEVYTPGGHSSVPRDHTSIGMMSHFIVGYEGEMYSPILENQSPVLKNYQCIAEHGHLPEDVSMAVKKATSDPKAKQQLIDYITGQGNVGYTYLVKTSQAIDIVDGGDKINALPRLVKAMINHRIAYGNDDTTIKAKVTKYATKTAEKFNIGLELFGEVVYPESDNGNMKVSIFGKYLQPAPISPVGDSSWNVIAGSMRSFYEDNVYPEMFKSGESKYIVSPAFMTANTDTRHYWNLTRNIYKVQPGVTDLMEAGAHTHNEWVHIDTHLQVVAFYYDFISKFCGSKKQ